MKKKELLIIFLLAVLLTILTFHWWERGVVWDVYKLAPYPWLLTPFSYYQWWFPFHVFIFWFTALGAGWSAVEALIKAKSKQLKIGSAVFLGGIMTLVVLIIRRQIPLKLIFWSLVSAVGWWVATKTKKDKSV